MPCRFLDRLRFNSIAEFRLAAAQRAIDAEALMSAGRRTGAVYLWGYYVEMILKAAYFSARNFAYNQAITFADLQYAKNSAPSLGISPFHNYHDLRAWAELLVEYRVQIPHLRYNSSLMGSQIIANAQKAYSLWRESLRYHENRAYVYEAEQMKTTVQWFNIHADSL